MSGAARSGSASRPRGMFSCGEACRITGATIRNANYWAINGLVLPTIPPAGMGSDSWYSFTDVLVLAAVARLQRSTSADVRKRIAEEIRRRPKARWAYVDVDDFTCLTLDLAALRTLVQFAADSLARALAVVQHPSG